MQKYNDLFNNYCFQPVANETSGVHGKPPSLFELLCKETCLCLVTQGPPVVPPLAVLGCGQHCQHIGLCAGLI